MDGIEKITTVDGLKAAFPDLTRQIEDAATTAERKRIQDIEDVALAGYESIVNDAKFNNPIAATIAFATSPAAMGLLNLHQEPRRRRAEERCGRRWSGRT